jgi:hypothetical protein
MIVNENGWENHQAPKEEVKEALKSKKLKKEEPVAEEVAVVAEE